MGMFGGGSGAGAATATPTVASQPSMGTIGGSNTQAQLDARKAWIDSMGPGWAGHGSATRDYEYDLRVFNEKNTPQPTVTADTPATGTGTDTTATPTTAATPAPYTGPKGVSDEDWFVAQDKKRTYGKTIADMQAATTTAGSKGSTLGGGTTTKLG